MDEIRAGAGMALRKDNGDGMSLFAHAVSPSDIDRGNWREVPEQERVDYLAVQEAEADQDDVDIVLDAWEESL